MSRIATEHWILFEIIAKKEDKTKRGLVKSYAIHPHINLSNTEDYNLQMLQNHSVKMFRLQQDCPDWPIVSITISSVSPTITVFNDKIV